MIIIRGKYSYKKLTIGVRNSKDILQDKINDNIEFFQFIPAPIYALLIIMTGDFKYHLYNLELLITKLKDNGLTFKNEKISLLKLKYYI